MYLIYFVIIFYLRSRFDRISSPTYSYWHLSLLSTHIYTHWITDRGWKKAPYLVAPVNMVAMYCSSSNIVIFYSNFPMINFRHAPVALRRLAGKTRANHGATELWGIAYRTVQWGGDAVALLVSARPRRCGRPLYHTYSSCVGELSLTNCGC